MLMMAKMGAVSFAGQGGSAFPGVTLTSVNIGGSGVYGYAIPFGYLDTQFGINGGDLSQTILTGYQTTDIFDGGSGVSVIFYGDATAALSGYSKLKINGVDHNLGTPYTDLGLTIVEAATATLSTGTYNVQLV